MFTLNILDIDYHVFKEKSNYDLIKIIQLIYKFKKDPEKLKGIIIDQDIAIIVASIVDEEDDVLKKIVLKQGGRVDMCESLREFYADGIREGYDNGIKEGYDKGYGSGTKKRVLKRPNNYLNTFILMKIVLLLII